MAVKFGLSCLAGGLDHRLLARRSAGRPLPRRYGARQSESLLGPQAAPASPLRASGGRAADVGGRARRAARRFKRSGAPPSCTWAWLLWCFSHRRPKTGSDLNYQLEFTMLLILCASLSLHALDFFSLSFQRSRTWVTLLQLPLGVFLVVNCRTTVNLLLMRFVGEQQVSCGSGSSYKALSPMAAACYQPTTMPRFACAVGWMSKWLFTTCWFRWAPWIPSRCAGIWPRPCFQPSF